MLSKNIMEGPDEDEKMLYRPQLLHYKYRTCLEKNLSKLEKYDPATMKSLQAIMLNTKMPSVTSRRLHTSENIRKNIDEEMKKSQQVIVPQWLKYDKNCLRFEGYFDEHVTESAYENWRVRPCTLIYYLDDDCLHVIEKKTENSGIPQGEFIKRRRVNTEQKSPVHWKEINIGTNLFIFGKNFRICSADKFTVEFYTRNGYVLKPNVNIPEIEPDPKFKNIDYEKMRKTIAEIKEYTEVSLKGGHPNGGLKQFLENDRKVLSFDISWYDDKYDKEEKRYKMNYYLSDGQVEVCEIKVNNSGKDPFPLLLRKSKLPKKPHMTYCPGLEVPEDEYYKPEDLKIGNYVDIYNRHCRIIGCDDFTRKWFKDNLGIDMESFKYKEHQKPTRIMHPIPPYNGFGSEEDSLLNVFYLNPQGKMKEYITDKFKRDKHILRFLAKLISPYPSDEERKFMVSFYLRDLAVQVYELPMRNNGRITGKFIEKQRIKNPYTNQYYQEKDFVMGNNIYINKFIFRLLESDEYTRKYMRDNSEVFKDSDINLIYNRIHAVAQKQGDEDEFLVKMLAYIDPNGTNWANSDAIEAGFKSLGVTLSPQQVSTICGFLRREGMNYNMEDLFNLMK